MGELTIEQMRKILDNAPDWAKAYNTKNQYYTGSSWLRHEILLSDLKRKVDLHYYGQSEEEELKQYAVLSQEKIEGGSVLVGKFDTSHLSKFAEYQDVIANQKSKIEQLEKEKQQLSECINDLVCQKNKANSKIDNAYMILNLSGYNYNAINRKICEAKKALRGES